MPKKTRRPPMLSAEFPPPLAAWIREEAERTGTTVSAILRIAVKRLKRDRDRRRKNNDTEQREG